MSTQNHGQDGAPNYDGQDREVLTSEHEGSLDPGLVLESLENPVNSESSGNSAEPAAPVHRSQDEGRMVDVVELGRAVKRERERRKMGLRAVADETGVSASTLSRIENGTSNPDADNIARLTKWLKMPMERFVGSRDAEQQPIVYFPQEATPDIVEVHLRADRNLTPESASALAELFRVAYQQFSRHEKK